MRRRRWGTYLVGGVVVLGTWSTLVIVAAQTPRTETAYWGAVVAGIQAAVVVMVLVIGVWTLLRDSRDRRVDRVYALHKELTGGEVGEARARLGNYLRTGKPTPRENELTDIVARVTLGTLRACTYEDQTEAPYATPRRDATMVLRFFERAWAAQTGDSVDDAMFCALIGRHAVWWDDAISIVKVTTSRRPLQMLSAWAHNYQKHNPKAAGLEEWGSSRREDFASLYADGKGRVVLESPPSPDSSALPPSAPAQVTS